MTYVPRIHGVPYRFENRYLDGEPVDPDNPRPCPHCRRPPFHCERCEEWHDGCLGHIDDATIACCGHGEVEDAYVGWPERSVVGLGPEHWSEAREATADELRDLGASELHVDLRGDQPW
jgi:hypothetical protein